eukprot:IDg6100t1
MPRKCIEFSDELLTRAFASTFMTSLGPAPSNQSARETGNTRLLHSKILECSRDENSAYEPVADMAVTSPRKA